ncbi:hypothetical protein B0H14DRAFT_2632936 [Mycena olivaceomarginata]|nr:hypothetical protein B0H14DRAFT_2632936 [Mycena olivaceomarginata]
MLRPQPLTLYCTPNIFLTSLTVPQILVPDMDWDMVVLLKNNVTNATPGWPHIQTAFLYPDRLRIRRRLWVRVPVAQGRLRAFKANLTEAAMWVDRARGTMTGSSDATMTTFHIDRFPFDKPVELKNAYTFVHAVQSDCGPFVFPNNTTISNLVLGLASQWKGNELVFKHGTTAVKGIVNMEERDIALVEVIMKRNTCDTGLWSINCDWCSVRNDKVEELPSKKARVDAGGDPATGDGTAPCPRRHRRAVVKVPTAVAKPVPKAPKHPKEKGDAWVNEAQDGGA